MDSNVIPLVRAKMKVRCAVADASTQAVADWCVAQSSGGVETEIQNGSVVVLCRPICTVISMPL